MEREIPFGNSSRENGPTFLDFPLFPGIFQWDEPTKRVPFTAEPEIPEFLTKWKAPYSKARLPARCSGNEPALLPRKEGGEGQDWTRRERREQWKSSLLMTTVTFWFLHFWKYCFGTNGTPENVVLPSGSEFVNYFLNASCYFFCE